MKPTEITIGKIKIGGNNPIMIQSMAATKTSNKKETLKQIQLLEKAGAGLIRIAIDNKNDVEALKWLREKTKAHLSADLQENFILAQFIAPYVEKIRYNPGHLHHLQPSKTIKQKVEWIVNIAKQHSCALRIGVNCGSIAPEFLKKYSNKNDALIESTIYHISLMDEFNFKNFCISIKDSNPEKVVELNQKIYHLRPDINIHLGVTEAGMPPEGVIKTRYAFEKLISQGIGSTVRVSLTLPFNKKNEEIRIAKQIIKDIKNGVFWNSKLQKKGYNIISCPSCSRVENKEFIKLAQAVKKMTKSMPKDKKLSIAVMGCRVNGPGETDNADFGLWCGPKLVNLKKGEKIIGAFSYDKVLNKLKSLIATF